MLSLYRQSSTFLSTKHYKFVQLFLEKNVERRAKSEDQIEGEVQDMQLIYSISRLVKWEEYSGGSIERKKWRKCSTKI